MARLAKSSRSATFSYPVKVQVAPAEFELLESVRHLDLSGLSRATRAEIELGYFNNDACRQLVRAIIRKGMVTDLQVEPCSDDQSARMSPELVRLLNAAQRRGLSGRPRPGRLPVPVTQFFRTAPALIDIVQLQCYVITFFGIRMVCCKDVNGKWSCSRRGLIIQPAPVG